jgi:hypothetical protein
VCVLLKMPGARLAAWRSHPPSRTRHSQVGFLLSSDSIGVSPPFEPEKAPPPLGFPLDLRSLNLTLTFAAAFFFGEDMLVLIVTFWLRNVSSAEVWVTVRPQNFLGCNKMVEVPGFEPGCPRPSHAASTCVASH